MPVTTVEEALRLLHGPGEVFEIRMFNTPTAGTVSGYFDDPAIAAAAIARWDGKVPGIYTTLNPVDPVLLERAHNVLKEHVSTATKDHGDILRRRWLLIDVDFKRAAKTSATDEEVKAAGGVIKRIQAHLEEECGWPAGVKTMSGNGGHLLYRVDLPNDDEAKALFKRILAKLDEQFSEYDPDGAQVDQTVKNASRVVKVPGTMVCKGMSTKLRPHRRSQLASVPTELAVVPLETLLAFAPVPKPGTPLVPPTALYAGSNGQKEFDVEEWMSRYGLAVRVHKQDGGSDLWELKTCPFNPEHDKGEAFITRNASGAILAGCHHNSCQWWRWHDLRDKYEPDYRERQIAWQQKRTAAKSEQTKTSFFIDWSTFWDEDEEQHEWVFENVLARGRGHAIYAMHKGGKSLLSLYMAAQMATCGRDYACLYLDYEMTGSDVRERLRDMGYGPDTDFSHLHYALLPTLPPLDTMEGGAALAALVDKIAAEEPKRHVVVVIDTISRAVVGEENSADTWRLFYVHTGLLLKQRGVTWLRLDHGGKDSTKGQRGSSGKGDDVDVVWKLMPMENSVTLTRELARMSWVPERVILTIQDFPLCYLPAAHVWPEGTAVLANILDRLEVPVDATVRTAGTRLREIDEGRRHELVSAALKWRRERLAKIVSSHFKEPGEQGEMSRDEVLSLSLCHPASVRGNTSGEHGEQDSEPLGNSVKESGEQGQSSLGNTPGNSGEQGRGVLGNGGPSLLREAPFPPGRRPFEPIEMGDM